MVPTSHLDAEPRLLKDHPTASALDCSVLFLGLHCPDDVIGWGPPQDNSPFNQLLYALKEEAKAFGAQLDRILADGAIFVFEANAGKDIPAIRAIAFAEALLSADPKKTAQSAIAPLGPIGIADGPVPFSTTSNGGRHIAFITDTLNRASLLERQCIAEQADIGLCGSVLLALRHSGKNRMHHHLKNFRPQKSDASSESQKGIAHMIMMAKQDPEAVFFRPLASA